MNFDPQLSSGVAVFMALLAASMWGTWFISLKHIGDYPLDGFFITLFATSVVFVWVVALLIDGGAVAANIATVWAQDQSRILVVLGGGSIYVMGMRFSLSVQRTLGLSLAQPIQSAIGTISSLAITMVVGGVPAGVSVLRLVGATFVLILAVLLAMYAGRLRSKSQATQAKNGAYVPMSALWRSLGLIFLGSLLTPAYPFALSYGLKSTTQPNGLAVLPFMALLATGAFLGSILTSGVALTRHGEWHRVFTAPWRTHKFGVWSGLFHYGGNIIHTFSTAFLSASIAFPLGITAGLWTQMWGLVYGEFKGSPRRAYVALAGGILLYVIGGYIIATTPR